MCGRVLGGRQVYRHRFLLIELGYCDFERQNQVFHFAKKGEVPDLCERLSKYSEKPKYCTTTHRFFLLQFSRK